MNRKSGTFSPLWTKGKEDTLASERILVLVLTLFALALAVHFLLVVVPLVNPELTSWILIGGSYSAPGAAQVLEPDEAFVRSVALTGQNSAGYVAAGPCSSPVCTLSLGPSEAAAYAHSLAPAGDEAFVRSVALTGQNSAGYAVAGPCSGPVCTLSLGPSEAAAYAHSLALAGQGSAGLVGGQ